MVLSVLKTLMIVCHSHVKTLAVVLTMSTPLSACVNMDLPALCKYREKGREVRERGEREGERERGRESVYEKALLCYVLWGDYVVITR